MEDLEGSNKLRLSCRTPLIKLSNLALFLGNGSLEIYAKWEGVNATGTHKDRAAIEHVNNAKLMGYDIITVGTCGNYGVAISYYSYVNGIRPVIFVPAAYKNTRVDEMLKYGAKVIYVNGTYEDAVKISMEYAKRNKAYDANPGSINGEASIRAYSKISYEIVQELNEAPDAISIPVGNGTTLLGVFKGFYEMYKRGIISNIPQFIGCTTSLGNQIYYSWLASSCNLVSLSKEDILETEINEPLVSYRSFDGKGALDAIYKSDGRMYAFNDAELLSASRILSTMEGLDVLPASASAILGVAAYLRNNGCRCKKIVAILTGRAGKWIRH
ncbi:MAG: pyridoxal-phosphate dependent enzyme [Candidatus Geothermarchaeota archaeon]